jgi:hypothetical protein
MACKAMRLGITSVAPSRRIKSLRFISLNKRVADLCWWNRPPREKRECATEQSEHAICHIMDNDEVAVTAVLKMGLNRQRAK